jgi:hypothetical protein
MAREILTLNNLVMACEEAYGALVYPTRLLSQWAHHRPMFIRLPGKAMDAWLSRALLEAAEGHQLLVCVPAHMETDRVQKVLRESQNVLFLNRRLNVDNWSEGAIVVGLNIDIHPSLGRYGVIMEKRHA